MSTVQMRSSSQLSQDFPHKKAAFELDVVLHQLQECGFSFRTERRDALQVDDELTTLKIQSCPFASGRELISPWRHECAFNDHPALVRALDKRNP